MRPDHIPALGPRFWLALTVASVFGANTGDALAERLGFLLGLPFLAALFAAILFAERRDDAPRQIYYWAAIVVVRTAATNLADFTSRAVGLGPAIALLAALLVGAVALRRAPAQTGRLAPPSVDGAYWATMLIAGTLGTAVGDFTSFRSGLGLPASALTLSGLEALLLALGAAGPLAYAAYYWLTIVGVRAAGTALGDFAARRIGLLPCALATGALLVALLTLWRQTPPRVAA